MQPWEKTTPYKVGALPWKVVVTDIFVINNENLLCIVDYYRKLCVIKMVENLLAKYLTQAANVVFAEFFYPKIGFRCRHEFVSEQFKDVYRYLNIVQVMPSSYHH